MKKRPNLYTREMHALANELKTTQAQRDIITGRLRVVEAEVSEHVKTVEFVVTQRDTLARMLMIDPPKWTHLPALFDRDWQAWIARRDAALAGVAPPMTPEQHRVEPNQ